MRLDLARHSYHSTHALEPVRYFPLVGDGGHELLDALDPAGELLLVPSPRQATLLLLVGHFPERTHAAVARVLRRMPRPRIAVRCGGPCIAAVPAAPAVAPGPSAPARLAEIAREAMLGWRPSTEAHPDDEAESFRGPSARTDRDVAILEACMRLRAEGDVRHPLGAVGSEASARPFRLGPFYPALPPGLVVEFALRGYEIDEIQVREEPFPIALPKLFTRAFHEAVPVADLERARAAHHLRHLARQLRVLGVGALAAHAEHAATNVSTAGVMDFTRLLQAAASEWMLPPDMGRLDDDVAAAWGGPTARASGLPEDARDESSVYRELGFEARLRFEGDVRARVMQRVLESEDSVELADRAAACEASLGPVDTLEGPEGRLLRGSDGPGHHFDDLEPALLGRRWSEATLVLTSVGLPVRATDRVFP